MKIKCLIMKDKYVIVEFADGVQLVPSRWIDKSGLKCRWPRYDKLRYERALRNNECADPSWKKYLIIKKLGSANTYEDGMKKLGRSEYRSDVDASTDHSEGPCLKKKKTYQNNETSSEDSDEESTFLLREPLPTNVAELDTSNSATRPSTSFMPSTSTPSSATKEKKSNKVLRMVANLDFKVEKLQSTLDQILEKLGGNQEISQSVLQYHLLPQFPLETVGAIEELEDKLIDPEFKNCLVNELRKLGGKKPSEIICKQLKFLLTYSLGCSFSYFGTKDKRSFCALKLCTIIADVVRFFYPASTNEELKEPIQTWLRHCKEKTQKMLNNN